MSDTTINMDFAQTFQIEGLDVRGRLVRLGPALDDVLCTHDYPAPVAELLAETLALAVTLASALKYKGIFTLQIQGDGPISLLIADVTTDGAVRGYARYDEDRLGDAMVSDGAPVPRFLGAGRLVFTVDQGKNTERYQGIAALDGPTLSDCAHHYFRNSEQLDTVLFVASQFDADKAFAGAMLVQRLPSKTGERTEEDEDGWRRAVAILSSLTAEELLDEGLDHDALLFRLYHEDGVRVYEPKPVFQQCRCSREKIENTLRTMPRDEITNDAGEVEVVCEFCKTKYNFDEGDLDKLFAKPH